MEGDRYKIRLPYNIQNSLFPAGMRDGKGAQTWIGMILFYSKVSNNLGVQITV